MRTTTTDVIPWKSQIRFILALGLISRSSRKSAQSTAIQMDCERELVNTVDDDMDFNGGGGLLLLARNNSAPCSLPHTIKSNVGQRVH